MSANPLHSTSTVPASNQSSKYHSKVSIVPTQRQYSTWTVPLLYQVSTTSITPVQCSHDISIWLAQDLHNTGAQVQAGAEYDTARAESSQGECHILDWARAFDSIRHEVIEESLRRHSAPQVSRQVAMSMYAFPEFCVELRDGIAADDLGVGGPTRLPTQPMSVYDRDVGDGV